MSKSKDWGTESPVMGPRRYWPPTGRRPIGPPPAPQPAQTSGQSPAQQPKRDSDDKR
jgi:hypothetical protein